MAEVKKKKRKEKQTVVLAKSLKIKTSLKKITYLLT